MPITRAKKKEIVADLKEKIVKSKALVFAKFHGLSVAKASQFRKKMRGEDAEYTVAKKTLLGIAFKGSDKEIPADLAGEIGLVSGYGDELGVFRAVLDFSKKEKEAFEIMGGFFEGKYIDAATAKALGAIPSREALLGQCMSVLVGNTRKFVYMLDQIAKQKSTT